MTITVLPAPPVSGFSSKPANPHSVAFTDASAGGPTAWRWNFGDAPAGTVKSTVKNPTHAYAAPGDYTVTLSACNAGGCDATPASAIVSPPNRAPKAALTITSDPAAKGDSVAFDAAPTTDADGDGITKYEWAFDSGQFVEGPRVTLAAFNAAGPHYVQLRVTDAWGGTNTTSLQKFTVLEDQAPHPGFSFSPASPGIGQSVTFTSSSFDPDGRDLRPRMGPGRRRAVRRRAGAGRAMDVRYPGLAQGVTAGHRRQGCVVAVSGLPVRERDRAALGAVTAQLDAGRQAPGSGVGARGLPTTTKRVLLSPFPIVRMRARIIGSIIHIDLLSVKAPSGATVQVRCKGRRCPVSRERERVRKGARSVRFPKLERRLRAGTVLEIFVTKGGAIGTYTRFAFRAREGPLAPRPLPPRRIDAPRAVSRAMIGRLPMAGAAFGVCAGLVVAASLHRGAEAPTAAAPMPPLSARSQPAAPTGLPETATPPAHRREEPDPQADAAEGEAQAPHAEPPQARRGSPRPRRRGAEAAGREPGARRRAQAGADASGQPPRAQAGHAHAEAAAHSRAVAAGTRPGAAQDRGGPAAEPGPDDRL